jgi:protein involved in sex pheromone biosynthesis
MRRIVAIAALAFTIFLSGCVGWVHWRDRDDRHRDDQRQEQDDRHHDDEHR